MAIDKQQAQEIIEQRLKAASPAVAIIPEATIEKAWGWVFFYDSAAYLEGEDDDGWLCGNAPYIVERKTGMVHETGTADPIEYYIENFEATGDPYGKPGNGLVIYSAGSNYDLMSATKLLHRQCAMGLMDARQQLQSVIDGNSIELQASDPKAAKELCDCLLEAGFNVSRLSADDPADFDTDQVESLPDEWSEYL